MDEKPYQLLSHTCKPLPMEPGRPYWQDYEYIKIGTYSIFIFTEPLAGWRYASELKFRSVSATDKKGLGVPHTMAA
jgi:hypothetical protein